MPFNPSRRTRLVAGVSLAALLPLAAGAATTGDAKNVLLFVSDGASWGAWDAASYYEHGELGQQPYDNFDKKLGMTTNSVSTGYTYDAEQAWSSEPAAEGNFAGYNYIRTDPTDSAAAGTALATGEKTLNGRIDFDAEGNPLPFISQSMKDAGKSVGVVSSVPFSHATPAAFGAQNVSRNNYHEIAEQMLNEGTVDVLMGAGNPNFDGNGQRMDEPSYNYMSEEQWASLQGDDAPMHLIQSREQFEALASGDLEIDGRVFGLAEAGATLQYNRDADVVGSDADNASGAAYIENVPTLATMTEGTLQQLSKDEDGMFMMVEGGAVDWAAHANDLGGIIEEQMDFNNAVGSAVDWVENHSSWDETLMIVLTDHGNGMPMGPMSDEIAFQAIENNGAGNLPGVMWHTGGHTTENTLLWAQGAGADFLDQFIVGQDEYLTTLLGFNNGDYIENQSVGHAMAMASGVSIAPIPLPAGMWLLGSAFGLAAGVRRIRKRA